MPESIISFFIGGIGVAVGTVFQYVFRRYSETQDVRREVIETRLLQLQNSVESLYYRSNNLLDWNGRGTMSDQYYLQTSAFIFARILAQEALLVSAGVYAKLRGDKELKSKIKGELHRLNSAMDVGGFHHFHRVQLGEMAISGDHVLNFSDFLERWDDPRFQDALESVRNALLSMTPIELEQLRELSGQLVNTLARKTGVPSALELIGRETTRAPA